MMPVNMTAVVLANNRSASSRRRTMGCGLRLSVRTSPASRTIPAIPSDTICGELQPCEGPSDRAYISVPKPVPASKNPGRSNRPAPASRCSGRNTAPNANPATPMGTFTGYRRAARGSRSAGAQARNTDRRAQGNRARPSGQDPSARLRNGFASQEAPASRAARTHPATPRARTAAPTPAKRRQRPQPETTCTGQRFSRRGDHPPRGAMA